MQDWGGDIVEQALVVLQAAAVLTQVKYEAVDPKMCSASHDLSQESDQMVQPAGCFEVAFAACSQFAEFGSVAATFAEYAGHVEVFVAALVPAD